jgi:3-hydroxymyristoyl/3-hydroxydecanoyl-(acyl carrier protein) dehydratase
MYLAYSNNINIFKKIVPGDKLKIVSKLISNSRGLYKFESEGYVRKKIACKANFTLILPGSVYISPRK